jgi:carboxypeptidase PM20D1
METFVIKKLFLLVVFVVVVLAAVVLVRTALLKPVETAALPVHSVTLDEAGAVKRFVGAIQIPTESKADAPPDQTAMQQFRDYLQASFPKVHATMQREVLPDGALLFTWTGTDPSAKPVILMGHMDVVPVPQEALVKWTHPPYSGDLADGFIWGRGTADDKIHVLSLMEAAETLIDQGFTPARTILFAFGCDEENGGTYGAREIVKLLQSRGVKAEFVLDEGGAVVKGFLPGVDRSLAVVGIAEKGYVDLTLTTKGVGGHSSEPPVHTAIGQLSAALAKLEAHPFPGVMTPVLEEQYTAIAPYMPFGKKLVLANLWLFKPVIVAGALKDPVQAGSFHTTTAEDMVSGGFKDNALPPSARAVINFRILPGETTVSVTDRVKRVIDDPGVSVVDEKANDPRNPSPVSPIDSEAYKTLTGTIKANFPNAIVSPYMVAAATDATWYTPLSPNVYRFLAFEADTSMLSMIHGVNERIAPEKYVKTVQFTAQLIQNIR